MKNRSELREIIMKVLYQVFILKESGIDFKIDDLIKEQLEIENDFVTDAINTIVLKKDEIYEFANRYLDSWPMDRLNKVDQAILALGIYELKYTETPPVVAINEAVELSKKYSDEKVTKMLSLIHIYTKEEILPKPKDKYQNFVHMCDYLASRKFLDIKFEDNEIIE